MAVIKCQHCKQEPTMAKKRTATPPNDPAFDKLIAYLGANPVDFSITTTTYWEGDKWRVKMDVANTAEPDIHPITIQLV